MADLAAALADSGIRLRNYGPGGKKTTCPQCSHTRKHKRDLCLSITIKADEAVWNCHHCGWSGSTKQKQDRDYRPPKRREPNPIRPAFRPDPTTLTVNALRWFRERGISHETLIENKITCVKTIMPAADKPVWTIAFPYFRDGQLVNVKYRGPEKQFRQERGAEKVFYGLDGLEYGADSGASDGAEPLTLVIVEGEIDFLSCKEAKIVNVVSVPDGAPQRVRDDDPPPEGEDTAFAYVWNCRDVLDKFPKIVIATDTDGPGEALAEELVRRLGKERCWRARWPSGDDAPCKDANEVLSVHGPDTLRVCVEEAEPWPISGIYLPGAYRPDVFRLYQEGLARGLSTGWTEMDKLYRVRPGDVTVISGIPSSGKSEWLDALTMNLAFDHGWKIAMCSFENPPDQHLAKLAEKFMNMPFFDGPSERMSEEQLGGALDWIERQFIFLRAGKEAPTFDWILERARASVIRHGIRGLVIDPYNEVEHRRPKTMTETEYVGQILGKLNRFAENHGVHVWFVAHPQKLRRDPSGKYPIPSLYEISGSSNFANKATVGLVIHRDANSDEVEIHVKKVRFKAIGKQGVARLHYDRVTGRYSDPN